MNSQLHETTSSLISLLHFYRQHGKDNEKISHAIDLSQSLSIQGIESSSEEAKLKLCSIAVEAITSIVIQSKVKTIKVKHVYPLLDTEEIDFIQDLMSTDMRDNVEYQSDATDNEGQGKLYGT
jgi:hypothetical protein